LPRLFFIYLPRSRNSKGKRAARAVWS